MKISLNWLKTLLPLTQTPEEIESLLTGSGLEVEHFETVESIKGGLQGLIVGEVVECEKHPNADKLKVTKVNTGNGELLSIVCGAPNVEKGLKVIVAPVGTVIYPTESEPFKIQKAKIRGEQSVGMLCAEDEIGMGKSHAGLLILPQETEVGKPLTDLFPVETDVLFEIGLTANRGDAASHLGVARELATLLNLPFEYKSKVINLDNTESPIQIEVESTQDCPRYSGIVVNNVKVQESPEWLKNRLKSIGLKSINNVVDITNFVLHETGQPLHAFDLQAIKGKRIRIKRADAGQKFITLDEVEHKLSGHELMVFNSEEPMCIAGIYGGKHSGVNDQTKSIFLESAYFAPDVVRKGAKSLGIGTDSSFRFERGTDPEMCLTALKLAVSLLQENCGAKTEGKILDHYPSPLMPFQVELHLKNVERVLGIVVPENKIEQILTGLGINIKSQTEGVWHLEVPVFKSDVTREIDVIEEIIRIHGFENIPLQKQLKTSLNYAINDQRRNTEKGISELLRGIGYREIMTNSLISDQHIENKDNLVYLSNPLSSEMNILRPDMLSSALESIAYNKNRKQNNTHFFEFGKVYAHKEDGFEEKECLLIIASGDPINESWERKNETLGWYNIQLIINKILDRFNSKMKSPEIQQVDKKTLSLYGIKDDVFYTVLDWTELSNKQRKFELKPIPQFPLMRRDLSLILDQSVQFKDIEKIILKNSNNLITAHRVFDVYKGKPLESHQKSISIAIELYNDKKTLTDEDVDPIMNQLIGQFEKELKAVIRK
jgi:phenylalanyl-tRNA synthetase beta chain